MVVRSAMLFILRAWQVENNHNFSLYKDIELIQEKMDNK